MKGLTPAVAAFNQFMGLRDLMKPFAYRSKRPSSGGHPIGMASQIYSQGRKKYGKNFSATITRKRKNSSKSPYGGFKKLKKTVWSMKKKISKIPRVARALYLDALKLQVSLIFYRFLFTFFCSTWYLRAVKSTPGWVAFPLKTWRRPPLSLQVRWIQPCSLPGLCTTTVVRLSSAGLSP